MYTKHGFESPWLDCVKDSLIDTGFNSVWESQSFTTEPNLCKYVKKEL